MALTNKLKFKAGELVRDSSTGCLGIISDYLGHGIYVLDQVRVPFLNSDGGGVLGVMGVNLDLIHINMPNSDIVENRYLQSSRLLDKANPSQVDLYNQLIVVPENNQDYYLYDGLNIYLLIKDKVYIRYRGGMCPPFGYNLEISFKTYWTVYGNISLREILSVKKEELQQTAIARFSIGRIFMRDEIEFIFDWEREYAPFIIQGKIL